MIVYRATKADFRACILSNRIEEKILDLFKGVLGKSVGESELPDHFTAMNHLEQILNFAT